MKIKQSILSHLRTIFCALAIAGVLLVFPSAGTGAPRSASGPPIFGSGETHSCYNYAGPPRQVGENVIITFNTVVEATGTFTGTSTGIEMDVVHPDGSITVHGTGLFTGSFNGGPEGTLVQTWHGTVSGVTGHATVLSIGREGTGGLAGNNSQATVETDPTAPAPGCDLSVTGTYTARIVVGR